MAGAVRELVAKIKFAVDKTSASRANKTIQDMKKSLDGLVKGKSTIKLTADTTSASSKLKGIKTQLNSIDGKTVTTYVNVQQKGNVNTKNIGKQAGESTQKGGKLSALADNGGTIAATGAAMVAPLALPVKTAMDFEQAMSKVKAITNSTDADMAKLADTARELGKTTQFSATEAAQAMSYLGMAGWKTEQIIAGMPGLLDLAAASGEDLARVADIVSDDLTAFKMPAEQAAHMADVMAAASTNANTNVGMMGETFKYAGSIAGALGYSLEDVALATGLMANSGIKAEMAGTALRSIMNRMIDPPKEAAESLAQIGVSAKNADGTVKPFRQQLQELRNAMSGLTDAEKAEIAGNIAGTEAMSGFLAVVNASDADFAKMAGAVDNANGAAAKMAKTMNDNAYGALKELKSAIEDVAITIGNTFLKEIAGATSGVTGFIRKIGDFAKAHPKLVAGIVAFVAAAGGLLVILGGIGLALSGVMTAVGALGPVFGAIGGVLSAGFAPILAIIGAVAAAIYFVSENWDMVVEMFKPGLEIMEDGLQQLAQAWEALQPLIQALTPLIKFLAELIGGVIVAALAVLFTVASTVFNAIASFINWVCGLLGEMGSIIQWCADLLGGLISKAMDFIGLKGQIGDINTDTTNRLFDEGRAGGNYTQSQYNNFNLSAANQLQPAMSAANSSFGEWG